MTTVTPRAPARGSRETVKRKELVARLDPLCLRAFSEGARNAKARGNPYVELVHFIAALAGMPDSDLALIAQAAGADGARLEGDLARALDALPRGASAVEEFSDHIFHAIQEGWTLAALEGGTDRVRSGDILIACLKTPVLEGLLLRISPEFGRIDPDRMAPDLPGILAGSAEAEAAEPPEMAPANVPKPPEGALAKYATNLTERARAGKIDPVVGRDPEIRQIIDILMRRRQNNPILTGEAGVGKTAVVEGFALRLARGDVPPQLAAVDLWLLDIGLMQAGASVKGEFEKRLKSVIDEVQASAKSVILFIDEAHTLIGAGGAAGTGDAANLLKPALARGELRTVAATTWAEYKQHIEKDPALTRRFQVVKVEEPSEAAAVEMLRGVAGVLEKHHRVEILDEAIGAAVSLSHRYIPARQLPDKAISLLDTACARVAVSQHATPAELEDLERRLQALEIEAGIIAREAAIGIDTTERQAANDAARAAAEAERAAALERWEAEKALVSDILALRAELRGEGMALDETGADAAEAEAESAAAQAAAEGAAAEAAPDASVGAAPAADAGAEAPNPDPDPAARLALLRAKMAELAERQGERPLILPSVDRLAVGAVVQDWTGIPLGRMLASQTERALGLAGLLAQRVVGQDHAMAAIASRIQTGMAGLGAPEKPMGVFMLCGPSGVGKTETALALADALYGGEQNLISINMSEFQEAHTVSTLKGAPPGYVGYGKGGVLTEAVRRRPYSVILLDEVEKAHSDVHEIFFQVFDKGMMDDSEGRRIDFRNTLILMTSNVGTDEIMALTDAGRSRVEIDSLSAALRPPLLKVFPPALLGRLVTIPYLPLSDAMIETIAGQKLAGIGRRLAAAHGAELVIGQGVMEQICARCTEVESGGRMIDAILTGAILPELSRRVLDARLEGRGIGRVTVTGGPDGFAYALD
ncbi:type VI secretion system ATPase TssH [Paracoccus sp. P2]|uniref:Type VI secretion system ATPase TssH n=1 Tax=Paracoccus pantotrophus TaxID=82367 RepID=A0A1I5HKL6_PARPN|nr:type VI secretion system ATPase TssH [Paracoccus pantotrophus]MDF3854702.1 type VI secretion system ATPase TssH [Paracoccus pantotrophus]QFG38211.1 type VI secretion system ATPase TssH [Paracoccus pantotrophus]QLH15748.1 type VI secretion system ATPase TssH [Paracoccus pantotrophus]RDD93923.1 type VI secretion system ATPase TssH [Paracoccus pantotrophus]RKS51278.1 type VI secretion system protein VasG [Paracoccus pantotrophus]